MQARSKTPYVGQRLVAVLEEVDTGTVLNRQEYEVVSVPGRGEGLEHFRTSLLRDEWISPETRAFHTACEEGDAADFLSVTRPDWEFITDNTALTVTPQTTSSILLKNTSMDDYTHAETQRSADYRFYVQDAWMERMRYLDMRFRLEGTCRATPHGNRLPYGLYMPAVHFNVLDMAVAPFFRLDARAEVSRPANLGTRKEIRPQARLYAKLHVSSLRPDTVTAGFVANGRHGFWGTGWEATPREIPVEAQTRTETTPEPREAARPQRD